MRGFDRAALRLVIFDWDGTLMDSVAQIVASLVWAAAQHGLTLQPQSAANIIGLGLPEAMAALFPDHPALQPLIQADYSRHYVAHSHQQRLFEGAEALMDRLQATGLQLAVATGKSRMGLDRVLAQSGQAHRFGVTRCASETRSKPDPLMLQQILEQTGLEAGQAIMIGDTTYDLDMAQRIGMPRIGVSYGVHRGPDLRRFDPLTVVDSVTELEAWLLP